MTHPYGQQQGYPQGYGQQGYPPPGYPPQQHRQAPPPKKRKRWPWVVLGVLAVLVIGSIASQGRGSNPPAGGEAPAAAAPAADTGPDLKFGQKVVTLSVEGSGKATVSYLKVGGQEQHEVDLPWSTEVTVDFASSLVAQSKSGKSGEINCKIVEKDGGAVVADSTSSGAYAVATCSG